MVNLADSLRWLAGLGLVDVVLPFILVFTILFGMLQRTRVLGEKEGKPRKDLNAMMSFVMAFIAIASVQKVEFVQVWGAVISVAMVVIVVVMMLIGLLGTKDFGSSRVMAVVGAAIMVIGAAIMLTKLGVFPKSLPMVDLALVAPFIALLSFFAIVYFITSPGQASRPAEARAEEKEARAQPGRPRFVRELGEKDLGKPGMIWEG